MSPARKDLTSRMEQAAGRPRTSGGKPKAVPRSKPVRLSVDLAPATYRDLTDFCRSTAVELGRARVTGVDVVRALLAELGEDEDLAARVRSRIDRL
jgi:hypothetical protein